MLQIDTHWTLFLDRDGVINQRLPGAYVSHSKDFNFENRALEALKILATIFPRIIVVTNQQGIAKGLMTEAQLIAVHQYMQQSIVESGGRIDGIYYCKESAMAPSNCRKPHPAMALTAQTDFPEINFQRSIMVGDSLSDMEFGKNLGMKTVFIESKMEEKHLAADLQVDARFNGLWDFCQSLISFNPKK